MGTADGGRARFRHTEVLHFSLADQLPDSARHVFDWHIGIDAMLIEKIDRRDVQAPERGMRDLTDMVRSAIEAIARTIRVEAEAELGGDRHVVAERRERFSHQHFIREGAVDLRRIEKCDARATAA